MLDPQNEALMGWETWSELLMEVDPSLDMTQIRSRAHALHASTRTDARTRADTNARATHATSRAHRASVVQRNWKGHYKGYVRGTLGGEH